MSYILDALKKADSERQLGAIPNIHAQPLTATALSRKFSFWNKASIGILLALLVIMSGAFFLMTGWRKTPEAPVPAISSQVSVPDGAASALIGLASPPPAVPFVAAIPARPPTPVSASIKPLPANAMKLKADVAPPTKRSAPAAASSSSPDKPKFASEPPSDSTELSLLELPEKIRTEIPELTVGGYIYSANRGESQLLINKKLLHEGEEVAPGLTLEKMMPHAAILQYKGYRYRISY